MQQEMEITSRLISVAREIPRQIEQVLRDAPQAVEAAACCVLSGGHLLVQDVPGVGKTMLAKTMAGVVGASFSRVQGHPDLLPSDVIGVAVYEEGPRDWRFHPGPIFANIVLIDELNRCPQRTQSAFLEAMEEKQVTVLNDTHSLPVPQLVVATQNPTGQGGTQPLVESQLDRFALSTSIGYPSSATERVLAIDGGASLELAAQTPLLDLPTWLELHSLVQRVHVSEAIARYTVSLVAATRSHPEVALGASPRATIQWLAAARARALISGRSWVHPGDVTALAEAALAHRLILQQNTSGTAQIIRGIIEQTPAPQP